MRRLARAAIVVGLAAVALAAGAGTASAHPLGNFTVNHYDGLRLRPDGVQDSAVVDTAEIPTLQQRPSVDRNGDGAVSAAERAAYARTQCAALASSLLLRIGRAAPRWRVVSSDFGYRAGAARLLVSRLECHLIAQSPLTAATTVTFEDRFQSDRVGWHEITAVGDGVQLIRSPVPTRSVSSELRRYPNDLLSSPLNQRSASLRARPGSGASTLAGPVALPVAGPFARALNRVNEKFNGLVGARHVTPLVGLLAVLLALLLGASHAALPGHGKTVMAAYIAGRRGTIRDAVTVGATVTVTHTAGVLILGFLLTVVATLAGETLLGYLGVASGLLIAAIGAGLLRSAWQDRRRARSGPAETSRVGARQELAASSVSALEDATAGRLARQPHGQPVLATRGVRQPANGHGGEGHSHDDERPGHAHGHEHGHSHEHGHAHEHGHGRLSPRGLVGMGVAGGLVPSPTALVVLLAAIGLGRTVFGIGLVVAYGLGMAATLTAAGLLLVHLRGRLDGVVSRRWGGVAGRIASATPILTATLVLVVGAGLAIRGLAPLFA
ncbi:MAG: High-affinity nickel-transporter [Pseudonocardiales bacterium]|nr:MAG: High-affinity nickel-transporter [Pseudonocardiales bacterium]